MNRCLNISELIRMIFAHLGPGPSADLAALARLAITCRAFSDPALDILWHEQLGLGPLLACLRYCAELDRDPWAEPEALCHWAYRVGQGSHLLGPSQAYNSRSAPFHQEGVSGEILELLSTSLPFDFLLPILTHVTFDCVDTEFFPYVRVLLGPKITSIDLTLAGPPSRLALVSRLASKYPSLAHLRLRYYFGFRVSNGLHVQVTSSMIRALTSVRTLSVQCIDLAACQHLGSLGTLTSLTINLADLELLDHSQSFPSPPRFTSLDPSAALSRNRYENSTRRRRSTWGAIFGAIRPLLHSALTVLDVEVGSTDPFVLPIAAVLQPLLAFTNLSKVKVSLPGSTFLDDTFVEAMAMAWRHIEELSFRRPTFNGAPPSEVTFPGLTAFARNCPALHTLSMPLSAAFPPDWDHSARSAHTQTTLSHLHVLDSPIDDAFPVAAFLSCVFPGISLIEMAEFEEDYDDVPPDATWEPKWQEVKKLLPQFVKVTDTISVHALRRVLPMPRERWSFDGTADGFPLRASNAGGSGSRALGIRVADHQFIDRLLKPAQGCGPCLHPDDTRHAATDRLPGTPARGALASVLESMFSPATPSPLISIPTLPIYLPASPVSAPVPRRHRIEECNGALLPMPQRIIRNRDGIET
ncbi:hypothetical protein DFH09DRAFT_1396058 [Mycena vulgaris]|nr:hypothetical protein DFH09DRAFT_1396058 [Mycena vulgaris]